MALLSETPLLKDIAAWTTAGRLTRARFGGALALWLAVMMAGFAAAWLGLRSGASPMLGGGLIAIGLWFAVCATARRLHDMSHSGFWAILVFTLFPIGFIPLLITESRAGENAWGENPKGLLKINDPRLLRRLTENAREGSVMHEVGSRDSEEKK